MSLHSSNVANLLATDHGRVICVKKRNCHWVAFVLVEERYEVSFVVSQKQMENWQERPRSLSTTRNYCYLANAKLLKQHSVKRARLDPDEIRVLRFEPRDPDGHEAINVPLPPGELVKPKEEPKKLPKGVGEGQSTLFDCDQLGLAG